jgi:purine-binding chemotaxis protein CheW
MPPDPRRPKAPAVSMKTKEMQLVLFSVGSVVYGLPIERVREVVNPQDVIPLPHAPPSIVGVTDHRGEVVPVIDLRTRFGLPPNEEADARKRTKWIMVDVGEGAPQQIDAKGEGAGASSAYRPIACVVDLVQNVHLAREPLRPAPPLGGGEDTRGILGVIGRAGVQGEGGLVFVLDLARLRALIEPVSLHLSSSLRGLP